MLRCDWQEDLDRQIKSRPLAPFWSSAGGQKMSTQQWPRGTLIESLSPKEQAVLINLGRRQVFLPGQHLVQEGEVSTGVYVLISGCAKVTGNTIDGKLVVLDIRIAGDLVGEFAALDAAPRSSTVTAATRLTVRFIPQPEFHRLLDARPAVARAMSRSITLKIRFSTSQRLDMSVGLTEVRLARILGHLADRYGVPSPEGLLINVPLSQCEIADLVGSSQPNIQRAFAYLRRRNVVLTTYRRQVITNQGLLRRIADLRDAETRAKAAAHS
jgi:CRP/FNR family cyclic AMP-dependent transcriptional regulator